MKYLKTFENSEELEFGVTPEDIKYLFTDISDNGWKVDVRFLRKLFDFKHTDKPILKFGLIPYIEVVVTKDWDRFEVSQWKAKQYLNELMNSEEYLEIIDVAYHRLSDMNFFIQNQYIENKQIHILIYRKTDQNYIK